MNTAATTTIALPDAGIKHPGLIALIDACDIHLPSGQKLALIALARCRDTRTGRSVVSFKTIGQRSGCGERQASRHIEALMGLGLVARVGLLGRCYVYTINVEALAKAETCKKCPQPAIAPVDNSADTPDISDTDPRHFKQTPPTFATQTPDMDVRYSGWFSGFYSGGKSEAHEHEPAADPVEAVTPPLPIFEDLKTEQPQPPKTAVDDVLGYIADKRAEQLPIIGQDIRDLIEAAAACGEVPLAVAADAVRGCLVASDAPAPIITTPAPTKPAPAVAIAPETLAAVNAQRAGHDKPALSRADLRKLGDLAMLSGIAPQAAAEWILASPARNFFSGEGYSRERAAAAPVAPTGPVELTAAGRAAQAQIARALAAPAAVPARPAAPAVASIVASPSARPISAAVTLHHRAPVSVGGSTGTGWAQKAVARFAAGEPVNRATITSAAGALGLSLADLKAQRAATLATVAA